MNSPLVPSVIGNELKMRTLSFQNYTLLTVQSVRYIFTTTRHTISRAKGDLRPGEDCGGRYTRNSLQLPRRRKRGQRVDS
jgi:hypothetical protein